MPRGGYADGAHIVLAARLSLRHDPAAEASLPVSVVASIALHRSFALLVAFALVLAALVPFVAPPRAGAVATDLFFSEYIEGSSFNKALEIYNGTGADVDLAAGGYVLELYSNGAAEASRTLALSGTVASGDVYVLAHAQATSEIQAEADVLNSTVINHNGDDAYVLRRGDTVVDVIGQVGADPGTAWGTEPVTTAEHTLVRKGTVQAGDPDGTDAFDPAAEWDSHAANETAFLGSHVVSDEPVTTNPAGTGSADPAGVEPGGETLLTVTVSPGTNPTSTGVAVTADLGPIGGAADQRLADDGTSGDVTAGDLVFSHLATVGDVASGDKVITATISDAEERSSNASISLTVVGEPTAIWEIQGSSHLSEYDGDQVFGVEGVVTATNGTSFWMTDPTPDGDPATSDGILVFRGGEFEVGDLVKVNGRVDEFRPGGSGGSENLTTTEIVSPTVTFISGDNDVPTTVIGVDRMPPTEVIDDDSTDSVEAGNAVYDPANDGIDFWESLEGMRLQVADAVAVGPRNSFGEIAVISEAQAAAGVRTPRGGILVRLLGAAGDYRLGDFNPERLILDDVLADTPTVNVGDEFVTDPEGVLDYGFGNFKLLVVETPVRIDNELQREVTAPQAPHELAVATYNVENLSVRNSQSKFDELAVQIVQHLNSPDLIGIEEMQDDSGTTNNGTVSAELGWQRLIDAIVAAGGPVYDYRSINPENNEDGGAPGGNIRVGFLFRSDRGLEFVDRAGGDAVTDTDVIPTPNGKGAALTVSPGRVLDAPIGGEKAFEDTRKSLAGEFRWRGETLFVVVNHLSSKGDDRPLFGHFQPPYRLTEFESGNPEDGWRHAQAQALNSFVDEILAVDEDAHVIVLGDINDFEFSETVEILTGEREAVASGEWVADPDGSGPTVPTNDRPVLGTLFDLLPQNERYSYVFDGNSQVLDQILVSRSLLALDPAYDVVHINAEFAEQASDHDPSVMKVAFQPRRGR